MGTPDLNQLMLADPNWSDPTWLYRYFSEDGTPLYIGISDDFERRHEQHVRAQWWFEARFMALELFPSRKLSETAENYAIWEEKPEYNRKALKPHPHFSVWDQWYLDKHGGQLIGEYREWRKPQQPNFCLISCDAPEWGEW